MPNRDYQQQRREYRSPSLRKKALNQNPYQQFQQWMDDACATDILDPTAMTLATVNAAGQPHARIVLLKAFDEQGFVFYTHYQSEKGQDLAQNPLACLLFFWPQLDRQIRIEGKVRQIEPEASDRYFHSRPKDSQLAAYISQQSQPVSSRSTLEQRFQQAKQQFQSSPIPRPEHWGGYRLKATAFEFWQGQPNRLHDRFRYQIETNAENHQAQNWQIERLSP